MSALASQANADGAIAASAAADMVAIKILRIGRLSSPGYRARFGAVLVGRRASYTPGREKVDDQLRRFLSFNLGRRFIVQPPALLSVRA
jgi:hypothetical protein